MKTPKVKLPFTLEADATICPHCGAGYVIYRVFRNDENDSIEVWPQVGGYCYMCGKDTEEKK